ncbi:MAG: hypothetical protein ACE5OS_05830 [Anaerolineae bacterium]
MAEELPDWLAEMRDQQLGQQPEKEPGPREQIAEDIVENLSGQAGQADVLEGLREQMIQTGEEIGYGEERPPLARMFSGLQPWQRFVLSVLLFLNVALCGCMALVMAGRVGLP